MAQRVVVELTDDFDGKKADETVTFGIDGTTYEIDLTARNATQLRKALEAYISVGRRVRGSGASQSTRRGAASSRDYDAKAVRAWAGSHKIEVPARGHIPGSVIEQYLAAGS